MKHTSISHSMFSILSCALIGLPVLALGCVADVDSDADPEAIAGDDGEQAVSLGLGDQGPEVRFAYEHLNAFGYFPNAALRRYPGWQPLLAKAPVDPEVFDEVMEEAIRLYQQNHGLDETGELDRGTLNLMMQPRCGFPDGYHPPPQVMNFSAYGTKWGTKSLTYSFSNYTSDVSTSDARSAVIGAFDRWAAGSTLTFTETTSGKIALGWYTGDHGDNSPFDGSGNVLAHGFYPTNGDVHFDDAETWKVNGNSYDIGTVAVHEIGHALGLAHSSDSSSVMYAYYSGQRRSLRPDDIDGIQSIYGTTEDVGVIPNGSCPDHTEAVTIYMDDEDSNNKSSSSGWIGATGSGSNTRFQFCRVDGSLFSPLTSSPDPSKAYAVLKLGATCPNGSVEFSRYFDNEDSSNNNSSSASYSSPANIEPNGSTSNTRLYFCLFTTGSTTMSSFPSIGVSYGVLAASDFDSSLALAKGSVHTDDEDSGNNNSYSIPPTVIMEALKIVSGNSDTDVRFAKVQ